MGQLAVIGFFLLRQGGPYYMATAVHVVSGGLTITLSVIMGLPAVLAAAWIAIRPTRTPFADYLALRWTSWSQLLIGAVVLAVLVFGWDGVSRMLGREVTPGFMGDVLKSAQADGALWLLVIAFCVAAPMSEEILARGFLFRGWSESRLGVTGAIILSSAVWTTMHLQYDWFFFGEIFSIGLLLGYLRYRSGSTWADHRPPRPQQPCGDGADVLAGGELAATSRASSNDQPVFVHDCRDLRHVRRAARAP